MHIALLHETKQNSACKTREVVAKSGICWSVIEDSLFQLEMVGALTLAGDEIRITPGQRLRIAELAMTRGSDPERIARELKWQEFESLVGQILSREGYATSNHFIFKHSARKYEIDVLGAKEPLVLCVDCKHWRRGWARSRIFAAAQNQLLRAQSLSEVFAFYEKKHHITSWWSVRLLPVVLALADVSSKLVDGVPIVSALRLRDFLCRVNPWDERLRFIDIPVGSQTLLVS